MENNMIVTTREIGVIPHCIMLPEDPPARTIDQMNAENAAFSKRVQAYIQGKRGYEGVW
jgi:hypothetical protein